MYGRPSFLYLYRNHLKKAARPNSRPAATQTTQSDSPPRQSTAGGQDESNVAERGSAHQDRPIFVEDYTAWPQVYNKRPTFLQWLRLEAADIVLLAIFGGAAIALYLSPRLIKRYFPVYNTDAIQNAIIRTNGTLANATVSLGLPVTLGSLVDPSLSYPWRTLLIPVWVSGFLAFAVPAAAFTVLQLRIRSFWDWNNAMMGSAFALLLSTLFQCFIKWTIGGFRPHWLSVCQPDTTRAVGAGYGAIWYTDKVCTGTDKRKIANGQESFVSGHSTVAFASSVFLSLYLNGKLKVFANYAPQLWKLALITAPILGAILMSGLLTIDGNHHWYDIVCGAAIGTCFAVIAYRTKYAAVWDFRFNHVPLLKNQRFEYRSGTLYDSFNDAVLTRRKGVWDDPEQCIAAGAPSDAASRMLRSLPGHRALRPGSDGDSRPRSSPARLQGDGLHDKATGGSAATASRNDSHAQGNAATPDNDQLDGQIDGNDDTPRPSRSPSIPMKSPNRPRTIGPLRSTRKRRNASGSSDRMVPYEIPASADSATAALKRSRAFAASSESERAYMSRQPPPKRHNSSVAGRSADLGASLDSASQYSQDSLPRAVRNAAEMMRVITPGGTIQKPLPLDFPPAVNRSVTSVVGCGSDADDIGPAIKASILIADERMGAMVRSLGEMARELREPVLAA